MIKNVFEEKTIKNVNLPQAWQSQKELDELAEFLQLNWEQRAVFYEDGKIESRQQFLTFLGQKALKTNNYIGTIVFKGEQLNIFPKMFRLDSTDDDVSELNLKHLMHNLVQWLDYCTKIDYPYMTLRHCPIKAHIGGDCLNCKYQNGYIYKMQSGKELKLKRKKLSTCTFYLI